MQPGRSAAMGRACGPASPSTRRAVSPSAPISSAQLVSGSSTGKCSTGPSSPSRRSGCWRRRVRAASSASSGEMAITRAARRSTNVSSADRARLEPAAERLRRQSGLDVLEPDDQGHSKRQRQEPDDDCGDEWHVADHVRSGRVLQTTRASAAPYLISDHRRGSGRYFSNRSPSDTAITSRPGWSRPFGETAAAQYVYVTASPRSVSATASSVVNGWRA